MSDFVNHPGHYTRGPRVDIRWRGGLLDSPVEFTHHLECIEVIRHIMDFRLATAVKYIWRVAFGGKANDEEDIRKAIWYLNDYLEHTIEASP